MYVSAMPSTVFIVILKIVLTPKDVIFIRAVKLLMPVEITLDLD